eukprot:3274424-Pyramimonas_sp.AAC.1
MARVSVLAQSVSSAYKNFVNVHSAASPGFKRLVQLIAHIRKHDRHCDGDKNDEIKGIPA